MARVFFALWPDASVRRELAARAAQVPAAGGRRLPEGNLHLTLIFLGEVDDERQAALAAAAGKVSVPRFDMTIDRAGAFARAGVVYLGASAPPPELTALEAELRTRLGAADLLNDPEEPARPFRPHVTIVRGGARAGLKRLERAPTAIPPVVWPVSNFVLVRSETLPEGARYTELGAWPKAS